MKFEEENGINVVIKYQSGVYFLIDDEEVVYVGQSQNCFSRVGTHFADKTFDKVILLPCDSSKLDYYEDFYIKKYKPKYNKTSNYAMNYSIKKLKKEIKETFGIGLSVFRIMFILKKLNIEVYTDQFNYNQTIHSNDFDSLMQFIYVNKNLLEEIINKSYNGNKNFTNYIDLYFKKGLFK